MSFACVGEMSRKKSGNNCEYVAAGENKKIVSTMGDFGSAVLAVQHNIANFDVKCEMLAQCGLSWKIGA